MVIFQIGTFTNLSSISNDTRTFELECCHDHQIYHVIQKRKFQDIFLKEFSTKKKKLRNINNIKKEINRNLFVCFYVF